MIQNLFLWIWHKYCCILPQPASSPSTQKNSFNAFYFDHLTAVLTAANSKYQQNWNWESQTHQISASALMKHSIGTFHADFTHLWQNHVGIIGNVRNILDHDHFTFTYTSSVACFTPTYVWSSFTNILTTPCLDTDPLRRHRKSHFSRVHCVPTEPLRRHRKINLMHSASRTYAVRITYLRTMNSVPTQFQ